MLIYLLIVLLCLVVFHVYTRYGRYGRMVNKIHGPPALPILGNLLLLYGNLEDLWTVLRENTKLYYPIGRIWFVISAMILTVDPDDLKILLSDKVNIDKSFFYKHIEIWAKTGLITGTGDKWQHRRKIITPAFHQNLLKKYMEVTCEQSDKFIDFLKDQGHESVQSLIPLCSKLTLGIICESAMGVDFNNMVEEADEYRKSIEEFFRIAVDMACRPYLQDWMLKFTNVGRRQKIVISKLRNFADKIISERRKYHERTKYQLLQDFTDDKEDTENTAGAQRKRLAMLDVLLLAEKEGLIDDSGIKEEVDTFTAAGYDTTGMGMVYILMLLAENKEAQDLARAEAFRILNKSGGKMTMAEIQQLDYIERCIKETLRLFPTAPNFGRTITKDIQLKNYVVPAGSDILVPIFDVHRDPKFWSEPEKFNPDRFLPEEVQKRHPFAYLPFSAGPRNCIGQKFAMSELKVMVASILYNFYLEPVDFTKDLKFMVHIVLQPTIQPHLKFITINRK